MTLISRVALPSTGMTVGTGVAVAAAVGATVGAMVGEGGTGVEVAAAADVAVAVGSTAAVVGVGASSSPPQATNSTKKSARTLTIGDIRRMGTIIARQRNLENSATIQLT